MPELAETMQRMKVGATTGALSSATLGELTEYAAALCHPGAYTHLNQYEFPQIGDTVRINLLRAHIELLQGHVVELHNHITTLNKSNGKLQKWVAALAVVAVIVGGVQAITAILPYAGINPPPPTVAKPPAPTSLQSNPTPAAPPKVDQPSQKPPTTK